MELGALVCTARTPRCADCPLSADCTWRLAGKPPYDGPPRKGQTYAGTDRQCRGRLLAVLRRSSGPVEKAALDDVWDDALQRERSLAALIEDGLVDPLDDGRYALPR
jgi:A/G-specific adenine glycosylase